MIAEQSLPFHFEAVKVEQIDAFLDAKPYPDAKPHNIRKGSTVSRRRHAKMHHPQIAFRGLRADRVSIRLKLKLGAIDRYEDSDQR
jgi:hypothetical protein